MYRYMFDARRSDRRVRNRRNYRYAAVALARALVTRVRSAQAECERRMDAWIEAGGVFRHEKLITGIAFAVLGMLVSFILGVQVGLTK